jgi:hypothetical protein
MKQLKVNHMFKKVFLIFIFLVFNSFASEIINRDLYLDLMKKILINSIYQDPTWDLVPYAKQIRENGSDWPSIAHTMVGLKRLKNLQFCVEDVIKNNIPGDLIETGVWRGGCTIFMRAILKAYQIKDRKVWVADSFEGVPIPNTEKYPADTGLDISKNVYPCLAIGLQTVQENFRRYDLLDDQVKFLKGWFKDTLPTAPIEKIAVLRLDGDLYESTMDSLTNLYSKLSIGGYIIIDDYSIPACRLAVTIFRQQNNIYAKIIDIDGAGVYWKREI